MKRRALSLLLCLCLLLCLLPAAAFAEDNDYCKWCKESDYLTPLDFVLDMEDYDYGHHQKYRCTNHPGKMFITVGQTLYPHTFENGMCTQCGHNCSHRFENSKCTLCDVVCTEHQWSWRTGNGEYWEECSVCGLAKAKSALPDLLVNAPDKVCRTQDYVFSFTLPENCTNPGYNWDFSLKGDGSELTPVDDVCTVTVKSDYYVDGESTFTVSASAYINGVFFTNSKTVTIVDEHTGGTATCANKAVCDICNEPYGTIDRANHTGGTELRGDKPATCTEDGYTGDTYCKGCEAVLETGKVLPAEGHLGGVANCANKAVCDICDEPYGELDKSNHTGGTEVRGAKPATDTEDGYTGDTYCLGCGELLALGEVIPAEKPVVPSEEPVLPSEEPVVPSEKPVDNTDAPKTGDSSSVTLWFALLLFSGAAIVKTVKAPKKKEK